MFGTVVSPDHATAHLTCLTAEAPDAELRIHTGELTAAWSAPATAPPAPLGRHARAALELEPPAT